MNSFKTSFLFLFLLVIGTVSAQEIITDRPDQTESSSVVPFKSLQIEAGALFLRSNGVQTNNHPSILWRYGISKSIEFRLQTQYESNKVIKNSLKSNGVSDLQIGTKIRLLKKENVNTEIAFLSHVLLPTANSKITNSKFGSINKLAVSNSLTDNLGIGYNIGYDYFGSGNGDLTYSVALGFSIAKKIGFFMESYGSYVEFKNNLLSFDTGFTYQLKRNLQFDISYGTGLNYDMKFFSTGVSWNIKTLKKSL